MKFGRNGLYVDRAYTHRLTESEFRDDLDFQDGGHDVIELRKVLPAGECTRSVCRARMRQCPTVPGL